MVKLRSPTGQMGLPSDDSEPKVTVKLPFKEVYDQLSGYLEQQRANHDLSEEDMKSLFELLLLSYFSQHAGPPSQIALKALGSRGQDNDYFEDSNAEAALAIIDAICWVAEQHFPKFGIGSFPDFYREGSNLAEWLGVTDVYMHGASSIVIEFPQRVFEMMQNAHLPSNPTN